MATDGLSVSYGGEGLAAVRAPRPLLYVPAWLRLEQRATARGPVVRVGVERDKRARKLWQEWCVKLAGRNLYGEPILRVVWSEAETVLVGGPWGMWDNSGNRLGEHVCYRRFRKYPTVSERWVLEMWQPPESFGAPEEWEERWRRTAPNGEPYRVFPVFPGRGDYAQIGVFADPQTGGYAEPTWDDLPGLYAVQARWKEKDPLLRFFELRDQLEQRQDAVDEIVREAADEEAARLRAETWAELGWRPRVSLAGLEVPRRRIA